MVDTVRLRTPKATARPAWSARPKCALSRLLRPRWRRRVFADRSEDGATFQTKAETAPARLSRPRWRRRDQEIILRYQGGGGVTFQQTGEETAQFFRPMRRRRDFSDQCGDGATFQTKAETARFSRPRWRRRDQDFIHRD